MNHQAAYFQDAGFSLQEAGGLVALLHAITIPAKLAWGFAAERIPVRYCLLACYATRLLGVLALPLGSGPARVYVSVLFSGLGQGVGGLMSLIWADYYGRAFIGTIRGVLGPFSLVRVSPDRSSRRWCTTPRAATTARSWSAAACWSAPSPCCT